MQSALNHLETHRDAFLEALFEFLRIPSVSAQSEHAGDARRAAEFVRGRLDALGFETGLYAGGGLPTVHGSRIEDPAKPTLLVYGHYDVQPPEPLDLWESAPFVPTMVNGEIRARGCADDKGPTLALMLAAECWIRTAGRLPVNLKVVIEGEEESGGKVVEQFLRERKADLAADALVIADLPAVSADTPSLCYGLRGLAAAEVTVHGPARDLHSGLYGGTVANPAGALGRLIAGLHDDTGRVAIEGFYEGVLEVDDTERERLAKRPFVAAEYLAETGSPELCGEPGFSTLERMGARPTCEINGVYGGYSGEGAKTIIPASAGCKITCRLVPGQDPNAICDALKRHLESRCPSGVRLEISTAPHAAAVYIDPDTPWARRACAALEKAYGKPPALTREGGSIPVVNAFQEILGVPPLLLGTYAPGERMHSPNERYYPEDFFRAVRAGIHLFSGVPA